VIKATFIYKILFILLYKKRGVYATPPRFRFCRLATNSLTGNWKPGGSILHPHHQFFEEIGNLMRVI